MSIQLNAAIYSLLTTNPPFSYLVGNRVFPIIAPNETPSPFVVVERDFTPEYTNDGAGINESNVEITIIAKSYNESIQIAELVDSILNHYNGTVSGINIVDCTLVNCTETYQDDAFIQKLMYVLKNY